ncbi:MAG: hypothetical protein DGJ47_000303 [Rickettsiaceae bacterium]
MLLGFGLLLTCVSITLSAIKSADNVVPSNSTFLWGALALVIVGGESKKIYHKFTNPRKKQELDDLLNKSDISIQEQHNFKQLLKDVGLDDQSTALERAIKQQKVLGLEAVLNVEREQSSVDYIISEAPRFFSGFAFHLVAGIIPGYIAIDNIFSSVENVINTFFRSINGVREYHGLSKETLQTAYKQLIEINAQGDLKQNKDQIKAKIIIIRKAFDKQNIKKDELEEQAAKQVLSSEITQANLIESFLESGFSIANKELESIRNIAIRECNINMINSLVANYDNQTNWEGSVSLSIQHGAYQLIKLLKPLDAAFDDTKGGESMIAAIESENAELALELYKTGVNPNIVISGISPIELATTKKDLDLVIALLMDPKVDAKKWQDYYSKYAREALITTAQQVVSEPLNVVQNGVNKVTETAVTIVSNVASDITQRLVSKLKKKPLNQASNIVKNIIDHQDKPSEILKILFKYYSVDQEAKVSGLLRAVENGNTSCVKLLSENKTRIYDKINTNDDHTSIVSYQDNINNTHFVPCNKIIQTAVSNLREDPSQNNIEVLQILLQHNQLSNSDIEYVIKDILEKMPDETGSHDKIFKIFLPIFLHSQKSFTIDGKPLEEYLVNKGKLHDLKILHETQFYKNYINDKGETLLHIAAANADLEMVQYLIDNKIVTNISLRDLKGNNPGHMVLLSYFAKVANNQEVNFEATYGPILELLLSNNLEQYRPNDEGYGVKQMYDMLSSPLQIDHNNLSLAHSTLDIAHKINMPDMRDIFNNNNNLSLAKSMPENLRIFQNKYGFIPKSILKATDFSFQVSDQAGKAANWALVSSGFAISFLIKNPNVCAYNLIDAICNPSKLSKKAYQAALNFIDHKANEFLKTLSQYGSSCEIKQKEIEGPSPKIEEIDEGLDSEESYEEQSDKNELDLPPSYEESSEDEVVIQFEKSYSGIENAQRLLDIAELLDVGCEESSEDGTVVQFEKDCNDIEEISTQELDITKLLEASLRGDSTEEINYASSEDVEEHSEEKQPRFITEPVSFRNLLTTSFSSFSRTGSHENDQFNSSVSLSAGSECDANEQGYFNSFRAGRGFNNSFLPNSAHYDYQTNNVITSPLLLGSSNYEDID